MDFAGIAEGDAECRNVMGDHASCPDYSTISDLDAGQNNGTSANPHVVSDGDWLGQADFTPFQIVGRMGGRINLDVGSNPAVVSDSHFRAVQDGHVEIEKSFVPDKNIFPAIAMKWRFQVGVLSKVPEQILKNFFPFFVFFRKGEVQLLDKLLGAQSFLKGFFALGAKMHAIDAAENFFWHFFGWVHRISLERGLLQNIKLDRLGILFSKDDLHLLLGCF